MAPSTATDLQAPTAGKAGALYPPKPVAAEEQHFIWEGPGHLLATDDPAQSLDHRQLPALPLAQDALVQHLMLDASEGQAPEMLTPPADAQLVVEMQTPAGG